MVRISLESLRHNSAIVVSKPNQKTPVIIMALIVAAIGIAVPLCLSHLIFNPPPPPPVPPTPTPAPPPFTTISVLLIGVDSCDVPQPNLESVTVVKYQTEVYKYFLIAVSPDTLTCPITSTQPAKKLRDFYAEDARCNRQSFLTQAALEGISSEFGGIYYAEVDFDRRAISKTMSLLGPVSCMGQTQTGAEWLHSFDALPVTAAEQRLHIQGSLLQCIFMAAKTQNWDFPKLMNQLGVRLYPTRDHAEATFEAAPPLPQSTHASPEGAAPRHAGAVLIDPK